jgi:hypothetical protein
MFEVNETYANRRGKYVVLAINSPKMQVRFEDGTHAELNIDIQHRIWDNMQAEVEARSASRSRLHRDRTSTTQFFIKPISILAAEELTFPGWQERVAATGSSEQEIRSGDRLIYYAIEAQVFFAVATITGASFESNKNKDKDEEGRQVQFFPIDLDAHAHNLDKAVTLDSVELESQPNLKSLLNKPDTYIVINEDDFELLAELLTEVAEEEDEDEDEEEEEEDEDED